MRADPAPDGYAAPADCIAFARSLAGSESLPPKEASSRRHRGQIALTAMAMLAPGGVRG